jgi:NAD(P)-dependent dehydrogenase (short-subunit alcohol dehydrogenase family)
MVEYGFDLTDQVAIVTGGGTGIGEATAKLFARFGAHTVIASRKLENLERVAGEIESSTDRRCIPIQCDVRDEASVDAMVARAFDELGRIDILVNNSGGGYLSPLLDTPAEKWDNSIALNLRGPFLCTKAVGQHMIDNGGGRIVNISSGAGVSGVRGGAAYSAGKAGLQMFTRVTASEWGKHNIRCNAVAVGLVANEGSRRSWARSGMDEDAIARGFPLRRVGYPDDIAWPILFFVSTASDYVSGETLFVAGGPSLGGLPDED